MPSWYCGKSNDTTLLMTGHKEKSEFCFLEIVNIPGGKARRILGLMREKFLCASPRATHEVFCHTSQLKNGTTCNLIFLL